MRILFLTSGRDAPASRFRVQQFLPSLKSAGHVCDVKPSRPEKYRGLRFLGNRLSEPLRVAARAGEALAEWVAPHDVVFLERELLSSSFTGLERLFRRVARRLVLDIDDALFLLHEAKCVELVKMADHVIVGNAALAEWVGRYSSRVSIIPTVVDTEVLTPRGTMTVDDVAQDNTSLRRPVTIGWIGTAGNYRYLDAIAPALRAACASGAAELLVVAERPPAAAGALADLRPRFERWSAEREADLVRQFDIGLMPLADDDWSRYKCGAKLLQYMAAGIPAVASPVGANRDIVEHGRSGFLASSYDEWTAALASLIADEPLRRACGAAGRTRVEAEYSVTRWAPALEETLRRVVSSGTDQA